jgi:L-seryl-tRNA(Ser) seleniumtransferase
MPDAFSRDVLRVLPAVNALLAHPGVRPLIEEQGRETVVDWIRDELVRFRQELLTDDSDGQRTADRAMLADVLADRIVRRARSAESRRIGRVVNATGVILHTGLGRAPLSQAAKSALQDAAQTGNIEIDLESGQRRYRGYQLQPVWKTLTGAEDALVVNNNAAATVLALQALCAGREVIISRGQLIEIGGSFRLPDIFDLSGAKLREVGTTNRTHLSDYEKAIGPDTAAVMLVHPSNYRIVGFTESPGIMELTRLAHDHNLIAIDDIGSGSLVDVTEYGLPAEPTFQQSIAAGADVVLGSGDKLLGGPQCGIVLGRHEYVEQIRQHPLARAVRVGKLTLAALSATLDAYQRGEATREIPTLSMLAAPLGQLLERAHAIRGEVGDLGPLHVEVRTDTAPVGGGSLPGAELPTAVLALQHGGCTADELSRQLRMGRIRLFGRIHHDQVLIDLRSVLPEDDSKIALALRLAAGNDGLQE